MCPTCPVLMVRKNSPMVYRLADLSGQVWEGANRRALLRWVQTQNLRIRFFGRSPDDRDHEADGSSSPKLS